MVLNGKSAAGGYAAGKIFIHGNFNNIPSKNLIFENEEQTHLDRYIIVKKEAIQELEKIKTSLQRYDPAKAAIFNAHQEIVDDIIINEEIPAKIKNERCAGDWAIYQVYETVLAAMRQTVDPLISERAADFEDVRSLLLRLWYGKNSVEHAVMTAPYILAAAELLPSEAASVDGNKVLAIITEKGGVNSHTAIIVKSLGIPTVMGIDRLLDIVNQGQSVVVDAYKGKIILDPDDSLKNEYEEKERIFRQEMKPAQNFLKKEALTSDGIRIDIGLNIAGSGDKDLEASSYSDSVGLFRTEFLFMGRNTLPSEEEQFLVYRKILECYGQRPVILRTLDIGGDKHLTSIELPKEENPFLGNRALRFCFSHPEIFKTQIKAALRAGAYGNLWLMLPMVTSLEDIYLAKKHIDRVKEELVKEKKKFGDFKTGIMIEIPSIALIAARAAEEVDFASIGSNDLCQYLCAADRMSVNVESYYQSYHPAMFKLIGETVTAFNNAGKPVSICGELGSDLPAVPVLIGLGLRKLGMGAVSIPEVKRTIASFSLKKCEEIASEVLTMSVAAEIKKYLLECANK